MDDVRLGQTSRARWALALVVGAVAWLAATVASQVVPVVLMGLELQGATYAWVALLQLVLGPLAVLLALRIAGCRLRDVGLTASRWRADALVGVAVAAVFALLQFAVIIPATGGAARSDVVANVAQLGDSVGGLLAFVALAWAGSLSEELFFRGHLLTTLRGVFGGGRVAWVVAIVLVTLAFAALHGYQGWAGVIDTGLYGGLAMSLLYAARGCRLTAPIVAHAMWNTIACVVLWTWY